MTSVINNNQIIISNPSTGNKIKEINVTSPSQIESIIESANSYKDWSSLSINKRCQFIDIFRKELLKNKDEIQNIIVEETGKKDFDAFIEVFTTLEHLKEITKIAKIALKNSKRSPGILKNKKAYVKYEPLGVAGIISPWNFPLVTPTTTCIDGLLAGNNVILKPSEHTPLTAIFIKNLWDKKIGYNEAWSIINGDGDVGQLLIESSKVDIISFTGSTVVGKKIARQCSETLKPLILELGGKDPMIILEDADIDRAINSAIFGGLNNAGQACISVEEVFVDKKLYHLFCDNIADKVRGMSAGSNASDHIGSIVTKENYKKIKDHLSEIPGDKIISGKISSKGMFIAPTIILDADEGTKVVNEETFGPIISIRSFEDDNDLINKIHHTGYGLSASIFGRNKKRINKIISRIKTGNISINDVFSHYGITSLPFGGEGNSGIGRLHGKEGLRSFCRVKSIVESRTTFLDEPWWYNRRKSIGKILNKVIKFYKW